MTSIARSTKSRAAPPASVPPLGMTWISISAMPRSSCDGVRPRAAAAPAPGRPAHPRRPAAGNAERRGQHVARGV